MYIKEVGRFGTSPRFLQPGAAAGSLYSLQIHCFLRLCFSKEVALFCIMVDTLYIIYLCTKIIEFNEDILYRRFPCKNGSCLFIHYKQVTESTSFREWVDEYTIEAINNL